MYVLIYLQENKAIDCVNTWSSKDPTQITLQEEVCKTYFNKFSIINESFELFKHRSLCLAFCFDSPEQPEMKMVFVPR